MAVGKNAVVPSTMKTKLYYSTGIGYMVQATAAGGGTHLVFRGNGPYDPDYAAGGQQPLGFDQMHALYSQHLVYAAKIEVWYACSQNMHLAITASSDPSGPATYQAATAQPRSRVEVNYNQPSEHARYYSMFCRTADILGLDITDDNLMGSSSTTPNNPWYFHINTANTDINNQTFSTLVRITYYMEFRNPVTLAMS